MKHFRLAALAAALTSAIFAGAALAAPAAVAAPLPAAVVVPQSAYTDSYAKQVFDLMNAKRAAAGVAPLRWNQSISNVSQDWAAHLGVATQDPAFSFANIHRTDAGGNEIPAGALWYREIIGFNYSPANIVDWWMGSTAHRDAMLSSSATDVGIGYVVPTSGPYAGLHLVVSNLARYSGSVPQPTPNLVFSDIAGSIFLSDITWLSQESLTTGFPDGTYRPGETIRRDAMAAFLYRLAGSPAYTPPAVSPFSDVATNNMFYKQIAWLRATKLSAGYPDGTFRPLDPVNRDGMAAFMFNFAGALCHIMATTSYTASPVQVFADSAAGSPFYREISWMKVTGISTGYSQDNTYRGATAVSREAMAAFVHRLDNYIGASGGCR